MTVYGKSVEWLRGELEEETRELAQVAESLEGMRRLRGMDFYVPNPIQYKAHRSKAKTIALCAPNRVGKSTFGCMELCFHLTRNYPDWYPREKRFKRPIRAAVSATSFPIVARVIEPKIFSMLPKDYYTYRRTAQGYLNLIRCKDGSTVDILTLEMDDRQYESADWDFVWEDEPQHQRKREAIMRGLIDRNGLEVMTFTPIAEPWMKEEIIDKADGINIEVFNPGDIRVNLKDIEGNTILSEDGIKRFEESLSEEYKEARTKGIFFTMRGLIYKEFSDTHLVTCDHIATGEGDCPHHYRYPDPVICVLDPHDRLPHHVIWAYVDRSNDIVIDYELIVHCELPELARLIKQVENKRGYRMARRLIDPNFGRKPARAGANVSVKQELFINGVGFHEPNDDVELGHMLVRELLHYNHEKPVTAINRPKLYFSKDRAPVTARSIRNLQYQEWQGKTRGERDPKEIEKEKDNHGAACVRYLCIGKPDYNQLTYRDREEEPTEAFY